MKVKQSGKYWLYWFPWMGQYVACVTIGFRLDQVKRGLSEYLFSEGDS